MVLVVVKILVGMGSVIITVILKICEFQCYASLA